MLSSKSLSCILVSLLLASVAVPDTGTAQENGTPRRVEPQRPPLINLNEGTTFEVAPHTGLMGSSGTFGLNLSVNYNSFNLELAGEQVIGKTANLYPISVNVVLNLATKGRLIPYGAVGVGLWLTVPTNSLGDQTVSTIGMNFGGGARWYISKLFGFRLELKEYITSVSSTRELTDELLFFQEVSLGVTFMFH